MENNFREQSDKFIKQIEENFKKEIEQNEEHSFDRHVSLWVLPWIYQSHLTRWPYNGAC
jgi:hypothetical protein